MSRDAGTSTCPICSRTWLVTPADDCMLPYCGCFGQNTASGDRPCEKCGEKHVMTCRKRPRVPPPQMPPNVVETDEPEMCPFCFGHYSVGYDQGGPTAICHTLPMCETFINNTPPDYIHAVRIEREKQPH